jgi:peroxiredoxin
MSPGASRFGRAKKNGKSHFRFSSRWSWHGCPIHRFNQFPKPRLTASRIEIKRNIGRVLPQIPQHALTSIHGHRSDLAAHFRHLQYEVTAMIMALPSVRRAASACVLSLTLIAPGYASRPGDRIADFRLTDQSGTVRHLYQYGDKKAIVVMTQGNGCPIVRLAVPALREIRDQYKSGDIEFFLLNPNLQDTAESVRAEANEYEFGFPIWLDRSQKVAETLGVERTAEVFVIEPKSWTLKYHGPIDDRLSYEKQHPVQHRYLADALDAVLAGKAVRVASAASPGCLINFPNHSQVR